MEKHFKADEDLKLDGTVYFSAWSEVKEVLWNT